MRILRDYICNILEKFTIIFNIHTLKNNLKYKNETLNLYYLCIIYKRFTHTQLSNV